MTDIDIRRRGQVVGGRKLGAARQDQIGWSTAVESGIGSVTIVACESVACQRYSER